MPGPFQVQTRLTSIAMAVKPEGFIADMVCPRRDAMAEEFSYTKGITAELFTIPDTRIGRTSQANTVEFGSVDETGKVEDHGLQDIIPIRDINRARAQRANWDPMAEGSENTGLLVHLAREKRVADLIFGVANYPTGATGSATLSGNDQWSQRRQRSTDRVGGSDRQDVDPAHRHRFREGRAGRSSAAIRRSWPPSSRAAPATRSAAG